MKDNKIIDIFSDEKLQMNPKFNNQLRKELIRREQRMNQSRKKWGLLALAPVTVMAVAAVFILGGANWEGDDYKSPPSFKPQTVSAAELIKEVKQKSKNFKASDYSFISQITTLSKGPLYESCRVSGGLGSAEGVNKSYLYISEDTNVEAVYYAAETSSGTVESEQSFYDDSKEMLEQAAFALEGYAQSPPAAEYLEYFEINGQKAYTLINAEGDPIESNELTAIKKDGREVYELIVKLDNSLITSDCPEVHKYVIDADTKVVMEFSSYDSKATEPNLVTRTVTSLVYDNRGDAEALKAFRESGFDK